MDFDLIVVGGGAAGLIAEWILYGRFRRMRKLTPILLRRKVAEVRR